MIGQLVLPVVDPTSNQRSRLRAVLNDDMCWQCDDPEWANVLNAQFQASDSAYGGESAGRFLLYRAAERLGARVQLGEAQAAEPLA